MKYLLFMFIIVTLFIFNIKNSDIKKFKFMSKEHTTVIKGIAIILVIMNHMGGCFEIRYLTPFGGIGVALFLICSGYGLVSSYEKNGLSNYWKKKLQTVYLPYALIQICIWILERNREIKVLIGDLLIVGAQHPYGWYMKIILFWYIMFYILARLKLISKNKLFIIYSISIVMLFSKNELWAEQAFSFAVGLRIAYHKQYIKIDSYYIPGFLLVLGLVLLGFKQLSLIRDGNYILFNCIQLGIKLPIAYSLILYSYKFNNIIRKDAVSIIGNLSYYIYLIHGYTIEIINYVSYTNIILFISITIAISYIFYKVMQYLKIEYLFTQKV